VKEQRELLLFIVKLFGETISNYITTHSQDIMLSRDAWYLTAMGHFKEIGRKYFTDLATVWDSVEKILSSSGVSTDISTLVASWKCLS